jgi:lysophospholipase L1-like esterase
MGKRFPVNASEAFSIDQICKTEGKLIFGRLSSQGLGHSLYVTNIVVSGMSYERRLTLTSSATATDTTYSVDSVPFGTVVGSLVSYTDTSKTYEITAINGLDITLSHTLGVAIDAGDTIVKRNSTKQIQYNIGTTLNAGYITNQYQNYSANFISPNASVNFEINKILNPNEALLIQKSNVELAGTVSVTTVGYTINSDTNFNASEVIYSFGDSVRNPSGYIDRYNGHMDNIAKLQVNDAGRDFRLVSDYMSGKTSSDLIVTLKSGQKIINQADLIIFNHGINDAYQGTTDQEWQDNIDFFIKWCRRYYPNSNILLLGATKLANTQTTENTRLDELRVLQAAKSDIPNKIWYYGLDTVVLPNYNPAAEYFTDNIHPTQASHDLYGAGLGNFITTTIYGL